MLTGREVERGALDRLREAARAGGGGALVVRGEPGVGKTALLDYTVDRGAPLRVLRSLGLPSEKTLAYAGLRRLCEPLLTRVDRLPHPQRVALERAFQRDTPDRFLLGLAVLGLLAAAGDDQPLLCVVDDAQQLDAESAQTLSFVGRRVSPEPVALVLATRGADDLKGLPQLLVQGLPDHDAYELLDSALRWRLDDRLRSRIVAEAGGNPLALLQLAQGITPALASGFGLPEVPAPIADSLLARLAPLPAATQRLLLVAAVESAGEPATVWRAAARLGIGADAATPASAAGLVGVGVRFQHPFARSVIYRAAPAADRQDVHRALAEATDGELDPDRRAWHLANAAAGPDEDVARELERWAGRARDRGGLAASAAFLTRAAKLTPEPGRRAERALDAAQATLQSGAPDAAEGLLSDAQGGDGLHRARVAQLRAQAAFAADRGGDAPALLLEAARELENHDAGLARETYLEALSAAMFAGRRSVLADVALAALAATRPPRAPRVADLLLDGLARLVTVGHAAAAPTLRKALRAFREDVTREEELRWLWLGCRTATELWDDEARLRLAERHVALAREEGALCALSLALNSRIGVHLYAGELAEAAALLEELTGVVEATGSRLGPYGAVSLAAFRGSEEEAHTVIEAGLQEVTARGEGMGLSTLHCAQAMLDNSLGRPGPALAAAQRAGAHPRVLGVSGWAFFELIEAAAGCGRPELAQDAFDRLIETTQAAGTEWAHGAEAFARALLSDDPQQTERLYREAIARLERTSVRMGTARARLAFGEWLRRRQRGAEAVEQLRIAQAMFTSMGATAFGARAGSAAEATGRAAPTPGELTAQQDRIARLAVDGLSNTEIGSRLFISPRTVEYHLGKVFGKLRISSRRELAHVLQPMSLTVTE